MVPSLLGGGTQDVQIDYPVLPNPCNGTLFFRANDGCGPGVSGIVNGVQFYPTNDPQGRTPQVGYLSTNRIQFHMPVGTVLPILCPFTSITIDLGAVVAGSQLWTFDCNGNAIVAPTLGPAGCSADIAQPAGGGGTGCADTTL